MSVTIEYLGHAGFWLSDGKHRVVIDPFLTGNSLAVRKPGDVACDWLLLTHGHPDHVGDAVAIARKNNATVHAVFELAAYCAEQGCAASHGNVGGQVRTPFGSVTLVQAFHSSSFDGRYMGVACGVVVELGGVVFYHCGDTGLFGDMKLIGELFKPTVAMVPVGDRYTMGPRLATKAAELIGPKVAIPIHYATFPGQLLPDPSEFTPQGVEVRVMQPGETWDYGG